jgi:hypothetical protein
MNQNNTGINNLGSGNSGDRNSGDWNSGDRNSGNWNSGDRNSGDRNSGNWNSGYWNSGYRNSGDWNSGNWNSGNWNSGYGNSTNRETGLFNTIEPTIRIFNKDSGKKWEEINHPHFNEFYLNKWIEEKDMNDEEKIKEPLFYVREGYLKKYEYEEAWTNFWRDTDEENRQKFLNLPNFNADIFFEITGIDVRTKVSSKKDELLKKANDLIAMSEKLKQQANKL